MNTLFWLLFLSRHIFTILYYSLYTGYSTNNPQVLYISDITGWIYIGCLPARLLSVDQSDGPFVNGPSDWSDGC